MRDWAFVPELRRPVPLLCNRNRFSTPYLGLVISLFVNATVRPGQRDRSPHSPPLQRHEECHERHAGRRPEALAYLRTPSVRERPWLGPS